MAVIVSRTCDLCGAEAARETTLTLAQSVPAGEPGKKGRSERHSRFNLGDLCGDCTDRYAVTIGNLIASIKVGEARLPERTAETSEDDPEAVAEGPTEAELEPEPEPEPVHEQHNGRRNRRQTVAS